MTISGSADDTSIVGADNDNSETDGKVNAGAASTSIDSNGGAVCKSREGEFQDFVEEAQDHLKATEAHLKGKLDDVGQALKDGVKALNQKLNGDE